MKKILFNILGIAAISGLLLVGCDKEESNIHKYTPEELAEIARQDSLRQIIPVDYIFTQEVSLPYSENWVGVTIPLVKEADTDKLLELMGYNTVEELVAGLGILTGTPPTLAQENNDITYYAYNYSTRYEFIGPSTTNSFGHWIDVNSDVTTWGNGQMAYIEKLDTFSLDYNIGHLPGEAGPKVGDVFHFVEAMKYDTTSVAFIITMTIAPAKEIEVPVTTVVGTQTLTAEAPQDNNYEPTELALDTVAIAAALGVNPKDATLYGINSDGTLYVKGSTANNGYFFTKTGDVCKWGANAVAIFAEYAPAKQVINVGQYPDSCVVGQTYTAKLALVNLENLKQYNIVVNYTIKSAEVNPYPETTLETTLNLALSVAAAGTDVWVDNVLALDSAAIQTAIGCGPSAAKLYGVNAATDSLSMGGLTGNNGCWFDAAGNVCSWGAEGISMYEEYRSATQEIGFGQMPAACVSGTTYYARLAFVNGTKRAEVKVAMTIQ